MPGKLTSVWSRIWSEVWAPLARSASAPADLFRELIQALVPEPPPPPQSPPPPSPEALDENGELIDPNAIAIRDLYRALVEDHQRKRDLYETALSGITSRKFFKRFVLTVTSEAAALQLLEGAWEAIEAFDRPALNARFRDLVRSFFVRYSLRYQIREPFLIYATLPGLFSQMMDGIQHLSQEDGHLQELFGEFEEALADLRGQKTPMRIKNCLHKQFNLLEAFASRCPGVTGQTLGAMCEQLDWPHATIKEVGKKLYGFRSNYPGLGHAGNAQGVLRQISMRDFVSLSLMLAAFSPYVAHGLDPDRCYSAG